MSRLPFTNKGETSVRIQVLSQQKKMENMEEYSSVNGAETHMNNDEVGQNYDKDSHREVRDSFEKLRAWREESQREFSTISIGIDKGIHDLIEENCLLQVQLTVTTRERNDLLQTVGNLRGEIRKLSKELSVLHPLPNPVDTQNQDGKRLKIEVTDAELQDIERTNTSIDDNDQGGYIDDASTDKNPLDVSAFHDLDNSEQESPDMEKTMDEQSKDHICPHCSLPFSTSKNLTIHMKNIHLKEEVSEAILKDEKTDKAVKHSISIQKRKNIKFKCKQCPYTSVKPHHMKSHIKSVHENIRNHVCGECGYAFAQKGVLKRHIEAVHDKIKRHICGECGYAASQKSCLKTHVEGVHEKKKNHVCLDCGYAATQKYDINQHIKKVHQNIRSHICGECEYAAKEKKHLKKHIAAVHENMNHICGKCGFATSEKGSFQRHVETAHKNICHVCTECGYAASQKGVLKQHINAVHKKVRNHICGECGYAASQKGNLNQHIKNVHENIRDHVCGECGHAAKEKGDLKKHIERVHKNIRKYVCGECGYAASQKIHLKKHSEAVHGNSM